MLRFLLLLLVIFGQLACEAQAPTSSRASTVPSQTPAANPPSPPPPSGLAKELYDAYPAYREPTLTHRRFKHADIVPLLRDLPEPFRVQQAGASVEGRAIYRVSLGNGPTTVLLWSQMHGDEPTATAALFDLFRFFQSDDPTWENLRRTLLRELTLVFIPMLNPDGAERFERRTALGIDLNRDALRRISPEGQLLKAERDRIQAAWGFNLHDQSRYYTAGFPAEKSAALSFLAPAYNFAKEVNTNRRNAMQLIGLLHDALQPMAAGYIARYNDDFEPRAFGDNMQLWGTRTILIESGGWPDDPERQEVRRLNFAALLTALEAIAAKGYERYGVSTYESIPFNGGNNLHDLLLRELTVRIRGNDYLLDLAWRRSESELRNASSFYYRAALSEVGDLSYFSGYDQLPAGSWRAEVAGVYPGTLPNAAALRNLNPLELLQQGLGVVRVQRLPAAHQRDRLPLWLIGPDDRYDQQFRIGSNPPLVLRDAGGTVRYAVINGQLFDLARLDLSQWNTL